MMCVQILRFRRDRAICSTGVGKDVPIRRDMFPDGANVGDCFKLSMNDAHDGLTYTRITEGECMRYRQRVMTRREEAKTLEC